jgi:hypothetical protein
VAVWGIDVEEEEAAMVLLFSWKMSDEKNIVHCHTSREQRIGEFGVVSILYYFLHASCRSVGKEELFFMSFMYEFLSTSLFSPIEYDDLEKGKPMF